MDEDHLSHLRQWGAKLQPVMQQDGGKRLGFVFFGSQKTIGYKDRLSELEGENKCL